MVTYEIYANMLYTSMPNIYDLWPYHLQKARGALISDNIVYEIEWKA